MTISFILLQLLYGWLHLISTSTATIVGGYNISHYACEEWSCKGEDYCFVDLDEWYTKPLYSNCSSPPPNNISEAAYGNRTRKNILSWHDSELVTLMKAVSCSYTLGSNISYYEDNSFFYIVSMHGQPNWFDDCHLGVGGHDFGQSNTGCCTHMKPNFFTWHRLYMAAMENSLRMWDLSIALPYFEWTDYPSDQNNMMPTLITNISFFDDDGTEYRNPFYNFHVPSEIRAVKPNTTCEYSLLISDDSYEDPNTFWKMTRPDFVYSFYKQIHASLFYSNWVAFDFMNEVPHNNVHNLLIGNMPQTQISTYTPYFMMHHGSVEKYFLIWQRLMNEALGIDYTKETVQNANFGCFKSELKMDQYMGPFTNYTIDPIVGDFENNKDGFAPMDWQKFNAYYDEYNVGPRSFEDLQKDICVYFDKGTGKFPKCNHIIDTDDLTSGLYGYNGTEFVGWLLNTDNEGLQISFDVFDYGNDNTYINGTHHEFSSLRATDVWENSGASFLYRVDITDPLKEAGLNIKDHTLYVQYNISVKIDGTWYECVYGDVSCDYYRYIDYPIFIYKNTNDSTAQASETFQIHIGLNDTQLYQDANIIFQTFSSEIDRHENSSIRIKLFQLSDSASTFADFFRNLTITNDIFSTQDIDFISFFNITYENAASLDLLIVNEAVIFDLTLTYTDNDSYVSYDTYAWKILHWDSRNTIKFLDSALNTYADIQGWQGFDSSIFTYLDGSDDSLQNFSRRDASVTRIEIPWEPFFVSNKSESEGTNTLYGFNHILTGWQNGDKIQFSSCNNSDPENSYACLTNDSYIYDNCLVSEINSTMCGSTFDCSIIGSHVVVPEFEAGIPYYFISQNEDYCNSGLKLSMTFNTVNNDECGPQPPDCSILPGNLQTTSDTDDKFQIITYDDCETTYQVTGPKEDGWFAYAWFGSYTNNGVQRMNGLAIVVQWCETEGIKITEQILEEGDHLQLRELTDCNYTTDDNNSLVVICENVRRDNTYMQELPGYPDFVFETDKDYYYLYAYYTVSSTCNFNFGSAQKHNYDPTKGIFQFTDSGTTSAPSTSATDFVTTPGDSDIGVKGFGYGHLNVVIGCLFMLWWLLC